MMTSRLATEDTDARITTYNGAEITTYRNIKQAMHDRGKKELPSGDDGVWYCADSMGRAARRSYLSARMYTE